MEKLPHMLCIFDSAQTRNDSCFADSEHTWTDRTDLGRCRYVSVVMTEDEPDSGFIQAIAAVVVVCPSQLDDHAGERLRQWLAALEDHNIPVDLLATDAPVTFYVWLNRHAPRLLHSFRQDGEIKTLLPSWWRRLAEHHLTNPGSHGTAENDYSTGQFSHELVKRFLASRHQRD